ncbi:DNA repair protein MmcB-related protein [Arsenicitalea aurantiaca]|uniref:DNA repair protein MmcB-related protein n=1 Tax=Arsenicitalea aurantiaca TaxID=1783274 RepID=A0A433X848_9HYPH|nr:MmcB family DNA repair protein [Arsenicitalea aurantiaca]RUT30220.1 DNA repair protein MmcB-related protein [Arsenicitalea aurantiaca]
MAEPGPIVDLRQSPTALRIQRGVMRHLREALDVCAYAEVPLSNGRRADILGLGPKGEITIIEIKSSLADFRVDAKWHHYKDFCDRFYFAKPPELEAEIFPETEGLMVADNHGALVLREARHEPLASARRKAMLLKLARLGAARIHLLMDPGERLPRL